MPQTDEQLATAAKRGNREAFGQLVLRLRAPMIAFVTGILRTRADAEEVAQDVFLMAWQKLDSLREPARISSWLYTIARNCALQRVRKPQTVPLEWDVAQETECSADDRTIELMSAVGSLEEIHRDVISKKHFAGLAGDEIAQQLGIAPGTVRSRLSRAYAELRKKLEVTNT